MPPIHKGNKLGLCTGKGAEQDEEGKPVSPPKRREEKNKEKLVRVGRSYMGGVRTRRESLILGLG